LLVRVATINELGNHEIFKQSILKFDILINSHIVYSNIWSPYLVKVRMSVAILSHISGNERCMIRQSLLNLCRTFPPPNSAVLN
jgi:hypothetical protein